MSLAETGGAVPSAERTRPFLVGRGLVKRYPGTLALDRADGEIRRGVVLGLLGKNGAGKSTLIKLFAGAVQPDEGELVIDGEPTVLHGPHDAARLGLAFVHQELTDVPNLTVAENIELGQGYPKYAGILVNRRALRRRALEVLDELDAQIDPAALLARLSTAQRRLVMIARGLAANARLLVLDEPTVALTDEEAGRLHKVVRGLRDRGVAVIYVTHRLEEALKVTDRVAVMRDGRVVFAARTSSTTREQLIHHIVGPSGVLERDRCRPRKGSISSRELMRVEGLSRTGVIEDASFSLHAGEIVGIAGLVGAGRTELARLLFGADRPSSGRVWIRGRQQRISTPRDAMAAGIVLLPEDRLHQGTIGTFSVRKNITLPTLDSCRVWSPLPIPSRHRERSVAGELIRQLDIKVSDAEHPIRYLSGGNQQKVVLAKWLRSGADIFIFDEPTQGIDVGGKEEVYRLLRDLSHDGKGVILISSEFSELVSNCNRALVMSEGRIVGELQGDQMTESALLEQCYAARHG